MHGKNMTNETPQNIGTTPAAKPQKQRCKKFMQNLRKHYSCLLPRRAAGPGFAFLKAYHSRIKFNAVQQAKIQALDKDALYIYVSKYKSHFTFLFTYLRFQKLGLPYPVLGLDFNMSLWQSLTNVFRFIVINLISLSTTLKPRDPYKRGFIKQQLLRKRTAILPLIGEKSFRRRFIKQKTDPLQYIIELEQQTDKKIYLIPLLPILNKMPNRKQWDLFHPIMRKDTPTNMLWRFYPILRGKAFFEVSNPILLQDFLAQHADKPLDELANTLRSQMIETINLHRQGITGPTSKSRQEIKEQILTSERFSEFMKSHAESKSSNLAAVHKSAEGYLDEIAADFSPGFAKMAYYILHSIFRMMFDDIVVNQDGLDAAKEASRRGPLVFIPCHRSHIDYLVLSYIYYKNDLSVPLIAAGKNLAFWPMGTIFRKCGAFFIRRSFHGAVLYARVFSEYVYTILQEGYNIEQFIEGGRSRTGKLLAPKLGMLTILLNALKEGQCKDLTIVPIFIGYDHVVEEKSYLKEVKGGQKNPEKFGSLIRASKFLAKRHGTIYIQMAHSISVQNMAKRRNEEISALQGREYNDFVAYVGNKIISEINNVTITTPFAVTASAILNYRRPTISFSEIQTIVASYLRYLELTGAPVAESLQSAPLPSIASAVNAYIKRKFIVPEIEDKKNPAPLTEQVFQVKYNSRPDLDYYRNNCITAFIPLAFTSMSIMEQRKDRFTPLELMDTYYFLKNIFRLEFVRDVEADSEGRLKQALQFLTREDLLDTKGDGVYTLTDEAVPKLRAFASFILPVLETYHVALKYFSTNTNTKGKGKDAARKIGNLGEKMLGDHQIETRESLSKITIQNAVDVFTEDKLNSTEQTELITPVLDKLTDLVQTLH